YGPTKATLVRAGDLEPGGAMALVRRYFRSVRRRPPPAPVQASERPQDGERRVVVRKNAELPAVLIGWHNARASDAERPVLDVIEHLLGAGDSSRLHEDLVRTHEVATGVEANNDWGIDPDLFWIYAQARPRKTAADLEKRIGVVHGRHPRTRRLGPPGEGRAAAGGRRLVSALALLLALAAPALAADELRLPPVTRATFDNGLRVLVAEYHELPLVEFHLIVGAGAAQDPAGKEGLAALTAGTLTRGTGKLSASELARAIDGLGGRITATPGPDSTIVTAEFLSKDFRA